MFYCRINKILEVEKKKLTLTLSKVLTVCAKSLTFPGDAVPCPLGPEDTREPSMTSKPESKASEQLQWDSFALWPAIRYVFKPMDKNYSQHRWKPPLVEMQLDLALYAGHAPEKWRVKQKYECHILLLISRIFSEMHRFQGKYLLPRHTMYLYHVFFELWLHILPWAAEMNIKSSSMQGSHDTLCREPSRLWWFSLGILGFILFCRSTCKGDLEYGPHYPCQECKTASKSETVMGTNRSN